MTEGQTMTNLQGDAFTRATQIATGAVKDQIRADGRKVRDCSASELRNRVATLLANDPTIVERAAEDIERWILAGAFGKARRAKFEQFVQKPRR
jgi:hypothetical protein